MFSCVNSCMLHSAGITLNLVSLFYTAFTTSIVPYNFISWNSCCLTWENCFKCQGLQSWNRTANFQYHEPILRTCCAQKRTEAVTTCLSPGNITLEAVHNVCKYDAIDKCLHCCQTSKIFDLYRCDCLGQVPNVRETDLEKIFIALFYKDVCMITHSHRSRKFVPVGEQGCRLTQIQNFWQQSVNDERTFNTQNIIQNCYFH